MEFCARAGRYWLLLLGIMFANGVVRVGLLQPRLGEEAARQAASLFGAAIVIAFSGWFVHRTAMTSPGRLLAVGGLWLALTVTFEFGMGRFVSGASWEALLADYDLRAGRLWPLVLVAVLVGPWVWGLGRARRA